LRLREGVQRTVLIKSALYLPLTPKGEHGFVTGWVWVTCEGRKRARLGSDLTGGISR